MNIKTYKENNEIVPSYLIHGTPLYAIPFIFRNKKILPSVNGYVYATKDYNYCKKYAGLDGAMIKFQVQDCYVHPGREYEYRIDFCVKIEDFEEILFFIDGRKVVTWDRTKIKEKELFFEREYSYEWLTRQCLGRMRCNTVNRRELSKEDIYKLYIDFVV